MRDHQTFNPLGEFFRHLTPPAGTAGLPGPWAAYEYALDAWQRSVLLLDVLRQRANRPGQHKAETAATQDSDAETESLVGQEAARLLAALQRLSEVDAKHYEQHVRPLLEKALTPVFAHLLVERQLPRLDDAVFSDLNPLMQGVAQLAATVRAERHPAGSDNPYLLLQQQLSSLLADVLHTYADLRDQAVEQVFLTLRALPELPQLSDFVQGTQPAETKLKASVPAASADAPAKAITQPVVAAKVPAAKKTAPGKPAAARAAKPSRPQPASQQASLPGVAERPAVAIPAGTSPVAAPPVVAAVPAAAPSPVAAPTVLAPAAVASPVTAKAADATTPAAAPRPVVRPAPPAQARPDAKPAKPVTPAASTSRPAVKKAVAAPVSKTAAATPAAAMAATIAALAAPVEKTAPARASASTRSKKPAAKPAAAKSGTAAAKPVLPTTPRKR